MEKNISKEFYLLCKADGITMLNSKADIARMVLTAKNNGFNYSETELKEMFDEGKSILKQEQDIIRNEKKQEKIAKIRSLELKHIEEIKVVSKYVGTEKPISVLQKQISELQQELYSYSKQEKDAQELGLALYKAGEMKEKDWAIHGGIASGLAGGAAGLATALDIQQHNAQASEHNKQLMTSVVRMQMGATSGIYEAKERINERISELRNEIETHKKRLVEELQSHDLLIKLNPQVKYQKYTETGAVELRIETQPTPGIKIYDEITAVVDGSFKALLIDNDDIVGEVLFALPNSGSTRKSELIGYCVDTEVFNNKVLDVVFVPINLWAIETKDEILNQDYDIKLNPDYKNFMIYYSAKEILRRTDKGIKEYEDALWLLEGIPSFEKAKVLAKDCKTQIETIIEKEEVEREEKERIAKRNKKIAIVATPIFCAVIAFIIVLNAVIIPNNKYNEAIKLMDAGKYAEAIPLLREVKRIGNAREKLKEATDIVDRRISAVGFHTLGLKSDGTVVAVGDNERGQCDVSEWKDIMAISAHGGNTVGLKSDGTVVAVGDNECGQCDVSGWKDIVAISVGNRHIVGLKSDGTVVAVGDNECGQCDVSEWKDIVAISADGSHTLGLKSDGTAVATLGWDVSEWKDIVAISADFDNVVGLKSNGTVAAVFGWKGIDLKDSEWKDIVELSVNFDRIVGLKSDGTVVAVGDNECGQCDVSEWKNIVTVSAGQRHTVGLKSDGTVVAVGDNECGQCDVSEWKNIVTVSAGQRHTVGLKSDGTVVAVGDNKHGQCGVSNWNLFK